MSPIGILVISASLYILLLFYSIRHYGGVLGKLLIFLYSLISVSCLYFATRNAYVINHLMLWPFLYYIVISYILILPLLKNKNIDYKIQINNTNSMNLVCDFYLVMSVLYIIALFGQVIESLRSGSWLYTYLEMRGEDAIFYRNFLEQIAINVTTYLKIPILIYAFYAYSRDINYKRKGLAILFPFVNSVMWAIYTASRIELFIILLLYLGCFLLFRKNLSGSFKKTISFIFIAFSILSAFLALAVTLSRFGEGDSSWIALYFGDSFRVGHNMIGFTDSIGYGSYFFQRFLDIFHIKGIPFHCSIDDGTAFHSLIGMRYSDFGFIGTIIYALLTYYIISKICNRRTISIGAIYIVFYYFQTLLAGALYDSANAFSWAIVIVVSLILNRFTKKCVNGPQKKQECEDK